MKKLQWTRLISQLGFLGLANLGALGIKTGFCFPFFYCHGCPYASGACPLGTLEHGLYKGHIVGEFILFPFFILGSICMFFGRAACGWICPVGLLQRATGPIAQKMEKYHLFKKLGKNTNERYVRLVKYVVLLSLVFLTTAFIGFMFTDICPVGMLTGTFPLLILHPTSFTPNAFFPIALGIFILFILLIVFVGRGWCRYVCPLGAIMAPFNKVSALQVYVNRDKCIECMACVKICPMKIEVLNMHRDPECILCGKCISKCPTKAIGYQVK